MRLLQKRPLAAALFVFFAGAFLFANVAFAVKAILFGVALLVAAACFVFPKRKRPLLVFSALLVALAALLSVLTTDLPDLEIRKRNGTTAEYSFCALECVDEEKNVWLVGSVKDENGRLFCRLLADLPDETEVGIGDRLSGTGTVNALSAYARRTNYGRGCRGRLTPSGPIEITGHVPTLRAPFTKLANAVKNTISDRVEGEEGGLLVAVLLGETDELPTGTGLLFRRAGVSHALAVSGMHLVFLSAALSFLLRRLGLPRPAVGIAVVLFAFSYAALVGFTPSVLRAFWMLLFFEAGWFVRRQPDPLTSLALSGAVLLCITPYLVYSVSFLLSYLATLGILIAAQFCRAPHAKRSFVRRIPRRIGSFALLTLFAVLFTLPVSVSLFGELSLLSIPANLLLSLPIQCLLYLSVAVLILPFSFVGDFAGRCCALLLALLRRIASVPFAALTFSSPVLSVAALLPIVALLAVAFLGVPKRARVILCSVSGTLTLTAFLVFALPVRADRAVLLSDGSDNDLIVLRAGTSSACVDLGEPDGILPLLEKELKTDRIARIDRYVFTCYDDGATDGFRAVLSSVYVRRVILSPPYEAEKDEFDALTALLDRVAVPYTALQEERSVLGYEISLTKSEPYEDAPTAPIKLDLTAGGDRLLYLGENVPRPTAIPYGVTLLFLGAHGETPYLSFALDLPASVRTVFTGSEFYKTCTFAGGASDLRLFCRKRLVPDGFHP